MHKKFVFIFFIFISQFAKADTINISIFYPSAKFSLAKKDSISIDSISRILKNAESYNVIIDSYCDEDGSIKDNQQLAQNRCKAINDLFLLKGLDFKNIKCNIIGEIEEKHKNKKEQEKNFNRRSDIIISYVPKKALEKKKYEETSFTISESDLELGNKLVLKTINFKNGTADFLPTSEPALIDLLRIMRKYPNLEIEIGGHVCCSNDFEISRQRAFKVYIFLIKNGVKPYRMQYKGYGKTQPIVENDIEEADKKLNRRVEITILKK